MACRPFRTFGIASHTWEDSDVTHENPRHKPWATTPTHLPLPPTTKSA